jgi:hypothetical protein
LHFGLELKNLDLLSKKKKKIYDVAFSLIIKEMRLRVKITYKRSRGTPEALKLLFQTYKQYASNNN